MEPEIKDDPDDKTDDDWVDDPEWLKDDPLTPEEAKQEKEEDRKLRKMQEEWAEKHSDLNWIIENKIKNNDFGIKNTFEETLDD